MGDPGTKQKPCCWCWNKTGEMLLMPEKNKAMLLMLVFIGPKLKDFVQSVGWLLHWFVNIQAFLLFVCLSKLLYWFVKLVTWICQSCSMHFSPFAKQNQSEFRPRPILMLLLWTDVVEWIKVLNALGLLCLWKCLFQVMSSETIYEKIARNSDGNCKGDH